MKLYDYKLPDITEKLFYPLSFIAALLVYVTGFSVKFYTRSLIVAYIFLTLIAQAIYRTRYNFTESVSLAFLTVFMNSYYWEIPIHLIEYRQKAFYIQQVVQMYRLVPLIFFYQHFKVKDSKPLYYGLVISGAAILLKISLGWSGMAHTDWWIVMMVNRFLCLLCLVWTVLGWELKNSSSDIVNEPENEIYDNVNYHCKHGHKVA